MTRAQAEVIARHPESYEVSEVRDAGHRLLADVETLSHWQIAAALDAALYIREVQS